MQNDSHAAYFLVSEFGINLVIPLQIFQFRHTEPYLKGSGNPPWGCPMNPWRNSTTEEGKASSAALSWTDSLVKLFWTMNWARSPTTLELGVTLNNQTNKNVYILNFPYKHKKWKFILRLNGASNNKMYPEMRWIVGSVSGGQ